MALLFIASLTSIVTFSEELDSLDDESDKSCFVHLRCLFFLSRPLLLDFLYFMSLEKLYFLDDESDDDGSDSGSSGVCDFPLHFEIPVGCVIGLGSGFSPNRSQVKI